MRIALIGLAPTAGAWKWNCGSMLCDIRIIMFDVRGEMYDERRLR